MPTVLGMTPAAQGTYWCYGSRGTSRLLAQFVEAVVGGQATLAGFVDETIQAGRCVADTIPVVGLAELARRPGLGILVPMHSPPVGRRIFAEIDRLGVPILNFHGRPENVNPSSTCERGVFLAPHCVVGPDVALAEGVLALGNIVAHDVSVGAHSTLAGYCTVLGHVEIGADVSVGAGAIIHNGTARRPLRIGDGAVIGAGAVVDRDVPAGAVVVGPRAMPLKQWAWLKRFVEKRGEK